MIQIDMDMPECCDVCLFSDWSNLCQTAACKLLQYEPVFDYGSKDFEKKRSEKCPLTTPKQKTGKWIKAPGRYFTPGGDPVWCCSECGKGTHVYGIEHGSYGADVADGQWVACPNCGAMLEGEEIV